jgi:hypothetical protein
MAGWLEEVQRDPRTMGAFRRRIESLLSDPAVARRVAGRLCRLQEEGRASAPETEVMADVPTVAANDSRAAPGAGGRVTSFPPSAGRPRTRIPVAALAASGGGQTASLFGRCDCPAGCCLMVADLRPSPALAPALNLPLSPGLPSRLRGAAGTLPN